MRREHKLAAALQRQLQRRQRLTNARIVCDLALIERDVEIHADEHPLAGQIQISNRQFVHSSPKLMNVSKMIDVAGVMKRHSEGRVTARRTPLFYSAAGVILRLAWMTMHSRFFLQALRQQLDHVDAA